jgi:tetratricopeptide (TPR) repeat protein
LLLNEEKRRKSSLRPFFIFFLIASAGAVGLWIWTARYTGQPRLNFVTIRVNGENVKILPGERISLHPSDRVKLSGISSNIPFGVRLFCERMDIGALQEEEMQLGVLLKGMDLFDHYEFRVEARHKGSTIGYFELEIKPYLEDWLERADRIINPDQRILFLEKAATLLPGEKRLKERLLQEYRAAGYYEKALALFEAAKESGPQKRDDLRDLADLYAKTGNNKGLISALERLLEIAPDDARARFELAEALERSEKWEGAIMHYEALLPKAGEEASAPILKRLGYCYLKAGSIQKAIEAFLGSLRWDQMDQNVYYNLSYLFEKAGDKEKAAFYLRNAVVLNPDDTEGRLRLAERFLDASEWDRAERLIQEVLEKNPGSKEALLMLARIMDAKKDREGLINVYRRILDLDPSDEIVSFNLAVAEYEQGRLDEALARLGSYISRHPSDEQAHRVLFEIYRKKNDQDEAAKEAETLISLNPSNKAPYGFLFSYLLDKGLHDEIIHVMKRGLAANPKADDLLEYLLDAYLRSGREIEAMDTMEAILKLKTKSTAFLLRLATLREKHGQLDRAMDLYKRVLEMDPDNGVAQEAYFKLRLKGLGGDED